MRNSYWIVVAMGSGVFRRRHGFRFSGFQLRPVNCQRSRISTEIIPKSFDFECLNDFRSFKFYKFVRNIKIRLTIFRLQFDRQELYKSRALMTDSHGLEPVGVDTLFPEDNLLEPGFREDEFSQVIFLKNEIDQNL